MKHKRIITALLSFCILFSAVGIRTFAADTPIIRVLAETVYAGEDAVVTISLQNNPGIVSMLLDVHYDKSVMTLTDVTDENHLGNSAHSDNLSDNPYALFWSNGSAKQNYTYNGSVVTLKFKTSADAPEGNYPITVTYDPDEDAIFNVDFENVDFAVENAEIELKRRNIEDLTLSDCEYIYDGTEKKAEISGVIPNGASVRYEGNTATDAGTYTVKATVTMSGYNPLSLSAVMTIHPKPLTVRGLTAANKTYDGTNAAVLSGGYADGVLSGDDVVFHFPKSGTFASSNVGVGIAVQAEDVTMSGKSAKNYTLKQQTDLKADISAAVLKVKADDQNMKIGSAVPHLTYTFTEGRLFGEDTLEGELTTQADGTVCGSFDITQGTLRASSDYILEFTGGTLAVLPKDLPICTAPDGLSAVYGQTLSDIELVNPKGNTDGVWSWNDSAMSVGNASPVPKSFKARFVPNDRENFSTVENIDVWVTVKAKNIAVSIDPIADCEYTGESIHPSVTVRGDRKVLVLDTDYTVEYGENKTVGFGSVKVTAKENGNYTFADAKAKFVINPKPGVLTVSGELDVPYGTPVPDIAVVDKHGSTGDVSVYYYTNDICTEGKTTEKPTEVGTYWVRAEMTADENFTAAVSNILCFTVSRADIMPSVSIADWTYGDAAGIPTVTGNIENASVVFFYKPKGAEDSAYSLSVPVNAGEYTVKAEIAESIHYNGGIAVKDFRINAKQLDESMVEDTEEKIYTGSEIKPVPSVRDGKVLSDGVDFTYSYENNVYVGAKAKIMITGKGNYRGTVTKFFKIAAADQSPVFASGACVTKGGKMLDLKTLVADAMGDMRFAISGETIGCTVRDGILTSGSTPGTVKISISVAAKDVNGDGMNEYNPYSLADAFTVTVQDKETQATLSVVCADKVTYGQTLLLSSVGGSGTGKVSYTVTGESGDAVVDGNVLTPTKVGTVLITVTKDGDEEYNRISSAPFRITIEKIRVAVPNRDSGEFTYNGEEQTYFIPENDAYTVSGNKQTAANEQGYTVTVALNDKETHMWADETTEDKVYRFIVKKASITVRAKNQSVYIGEKAPTLGAAHYTVEGLVHNETLKTLPTIEYETAPDTSKTGGVVIKVYGAQAPDGGNYNDIAYVNGVLSICSKPSYATAVIRFRVKFETDGGSGISDKLVNQYTVLSAPESPVKEGYTFGGWYTDAERTVPYNFSAKVTKNFTLYAKWVETEKKTAFSFADVKENDWFWDSVRFVYEKKLMLGVSETEFCPNTAVTRAMFVTILYRLDGSPETESAAFADVENGSWYEKPVSWAKINGMVNGITETEFDPNTPVSREQMAAILYRYAVYKGYDLAADGDTVYADWADISEYAKEAVRCMTGNGIMRGYENHTFDPKNTATRAQAAAVFMRIAEMR